MKKDQDKQMKIRVETLRKKLSSLSHDITPVTTDTFVLSKSGSKVEIQEASTPTKSATMNPGKMLKLKSSPDFFTWNFSQNNSQKNRKAINEVTIANIFGTENDNAPQ
jgi:hypothetical protein